MTSASEAKRLRNDSPGDLGSIISGPVQLTSLDRLLTRFLICWFRTISANLVLFTRSGSQIPPDCGFEPESRSIHKRRSKPVGPGLNLERERWPSSPGERERRYYHHPRPAVRKNILRVLTNQQPTGPESPVQHSSAISYGPSANTTSARGPLSGSIQRQTTRTLKL
ncbi:Hypothetical protein CINCED_3A003606 [Cinara cedri]|uniref:Uncharacterized protein n=1 Tax=Cinara cedri TaxID=506608 RepID=A0A5E4N9M9_9HEMI|nr:Hypothetical protein CINCED_3A003606 [Cinara cedri]